MTFNYARPRASAERAIAKYGQTAQLRRVTTSGTPYAPTVTNADHACKVLVETYSDADIDGTRIKAGDKRVLISTAGLTVEPTSSDKLVIGGVVHQIIRCEPLSPGGTVVMWTVQARK